MNTIYEMITKTLSQYDDKIIDDAIRSAKCVAERVIEHTKNQPHYHNYKIRKEYMHDANIWRGELNAIASQNILDLVKHGYDERAENAVIESAKLKIAKRNIKLAKKLDKMKIKSVSSSEMKNTSDGFNATYIVDTDNGQKSVIIRTIIAGGYNIQCLHLRCLVNIY